MTVAAPVAVRNDTLFLAGLCAAGCLLFALAAAAPWIVQTLGYATLIPALVASGFVTIFATRCAANVPARLGLIVILGFALAMRLALVGAEPLMSTDIYRYIWDGRVQAAGINPYLYVPADPALAALRDTAIYPNINRAGYAVTAYLPVAEMFFFLVTRVSESLVAMRLAMVGCEAVIVAVLIALLRRLCRSQTAVVAYAWHPLAVFEIANNGHVEALMVALMMVGLWLLVCARHTAGAIAVAAAALVKPYAVFVLPAFWRPWDWRVPVAVIAVITVCYLPYLGAGKGVIGFLGGGYLSEEGVLSGAGIWLVAPLRLLIGQFDIFAKVYMALAAIMMLAFGLYVAFRGERTAQQTIGDVLLLATVSLFLMSPNYPWYFLTLVPFLALNASAPIWALTLPAFFLYSPLILPANDLAWKSLATLPFLIALAITRGRVAKDAA
jgi:hypothetical protein